MRNCSFVLCLLFLISFNGYSQEKKEAKIATESPFMIRHTVAFNLKVPKGSAEEREYFKASKILATIPSVHHFGVFLETSETNDFDYFFYMEFESMEGYEEYNKHPDHVYFVEMYWKKYVDKFIEIDYQPIR